MLSELPMSFSSSAEAAGSHLGGEHSQLIEEAVKSSLCSHKLWPERHNLISSSLPSPLSTVVDGLCSSQFSDRDLLRPPLDLMSTWLS